MKKLLKRLLPRWLINLFLPIFHWLQAFLANLRYGWPARKLKVIAITGTNGKTTTAAFLGKILERNGNKIGLSTTAFYQVGSEIVMNDSNMTVTDPFRLFKTLRKFKKANVDWVILEVTSHALSQFRILGIPIHTAVMTNLTQDHLDYHGDMDSYANAKAKLFKKRAKNIVLNRDDEWYHFFDKFDGKERVITYGADADAECRIVQAKMTPSKTHLKIKLERAEIKPTIHLIGKFNAYNALAAATTAYVIGLEPKIIEEGLSKLKSVPGRMEVIKTKFGYRVMVDYAHTADALENALTSLRGIAKKRIITVFGATGDRDKSKRPIMGKVVARLSDIAIVTDDDPYTENPISIRAEILHGITDVVDGAEIYEIADRRGAIAKAIELAKKGDIILLAGIGHQKYRVINGEKVEWSEREIAEELIAKA